MSIITLLTDFGVEDEYVGIMKGVILSIAPSARIIDITHQIEPQDLVRAAYITKYSYRYFPRGAVHAVVVDPGVGTSRSILALEIKGHIFLAPDNGILTLLMDSETVDTMIRVDNREYFLESVSRTFHGRDIFAPVAAHLANGVAIKKLGPPADPKQLARLPIQYPAVSNRGELIGFIVSIDRFGNLITNIDWESLEKFCRTGTGKTPEITIAGRKITGLSRSYENVKPKNPLMIIGSRGCIEIAVNRGSARLHFMAEKGDKVKLTFSG
ncbi:MAG TPA: SAM-dependent chlorinase/fluorinase [Desulfobacterales bacterium]|nr:SAM-dependent chlorinase/fluorinase [Desulfobacterales bacterium]